MLKLSVSIIYDDLNLATPCMFCFETEPKPRHQENKEIIMDFCGSRATSGGGGAGFASPEQQQL